MLKDESYHSKVKKGFWKQTLVFVDLFISTSNSQNNRDNVQDRINKSIWCEKRFLHHGHIKKAKELLGNPSRSSRGAHCGPEPRGNMMKSTILSKYSFKIAIRTARKPSAWWLLRCQIQERGQRRTSLTRLNTYF